jgi:putative transposase
VLLESPYYGYRRVTQALKRRGNQHNHKKILRIMNEYYLIQAPKKRFKPRTTNSNHNLLIYPNEIKHLGTVIPGWVWVADITYIPVGDRWCYLALIMDQGSRKIVGWSLQGHMRKELCVEALTVALEHNPAPTYHHSDRGVQYCSHDYIDLLKDYHITPSMADVGVSVDNPHAESLNRSLKVEEVYMNDYETLQEAREAIGAYITCYNTKRLHSSLDYMPPVEFEARHYHINHVANLC